MLTTFVNALAAACFAGFRFFHAGGRDDGFAWLLLGLGCIAVVVWTCSRNNGRASERD